MDTLVVRLDLKRLVNATVRLSRRVAGCAIVARAGHIDHADMLLSGGTDRVLPFRVVHPPAGAAASLAPGTRVAHHCGRAPRHRDQR